MLSVIVLDISKSMARRLVLEMYLTIDRCMVYQLEVGLSGQLVPLSFVNWMVLHILK